MRTLQLRNGDLVMGPGGAQTISGPDMIVQDLRCALVEPLGNDRFHPGYGSILEEQVGQVIDGAARFAVEQEVSRVVANYVAVRADQVSSDRLAGVRSRFEDADLIGTVNGINVAQQGDAIQVQVALTTGAGQTATLDTMTGA